MPEQAYSALSGHYDRLMRDFDYDTYARFIADKLLTGAKGIDLACGSGEMTVRLSKAGFAMCGADISTFMLNEAASKARRERQNILFLQKDLNALDLDGKKFGFVTAVYDGFNYVSPKNLEQAFCEVSRALNKDGAFIFDVSSEYKLKNLIGDNLFFEEWADFSYFWSNSFKHDRVEMNLTFFDRQADGRYIRREESHTQYAHKPEHILDALSRAGFEAEMLYDGFVAKKPDSLRLYFSARKAR